MEAQDLIVPERTDKPVSPPSPATGLQVPSDRPALRRSEARGDGDVVPVEAAVAAGGAVLPAADLLSARSRLPKKRPGLDIRDDYTLTVEIGMIAALLAVIGILHLRLHFAQDFENVVVEQEIVQMEEIQQTKQELKPPPPPRPQAPVAVANDVVLEDIELNLDAALDIGEPLVELPPPPPPAEEKKAAVVEEEPEIFVVVEQMPELIGGLESIQSRISYPEIARIAGIQGRVFVQFIVDEKGNVVDPVVVRGIGGGCDEEAIRAVKEARFKPGRQRGKAVKVRYVLPVVFKLR